MVTEKDIRDMYIHLRKTNMSISDEALNFMKHTCLKALEVNTKDTKSNFNGGYIKASQEAHDLLIEAGYKNVSIGGWKMEDDVAYFWIPQNNKIYIRTLDEVDFMGKQFYINNGKLSWHEPK